MARIWVMDTEMLGYKNLMPVADELKHRGHSVMIFGAEVFADQMRKDIENGKRKVFVDIKELDDTDNIFELFEYPELILTGIALRPGTGLNIANGPVVLDFSGPVPTAIKVALLGGYAGNLFRVDGKQLFSPDFFTVNDPYAAKIVAEEFPELAEYGRIRIIGNPHYDELSRVDGVKARKEAREKLGIKDDLPIVFYAGSSATRKGHEIVSEGKALEMVVETVNWLKVANMLRFHFIVRHHPRLGEKGKDAPGEIEKTRWLEALEKLENPPVDSSHMKTDEVLAVSDVVIAMPGGIVAEAAVLHKQVISLATVEVMTRYRLEWGTPEFPTAELKCCAEAHDKTELEKMMMRGLAGKLPLEEAQSRHFKTDGKNTERVCDFLEGLLD